MKKAIAPVVVVAALFLGYHRYETSYAPAKRYQDFAEEVLKRHYDAAAGMADGLSANEIAKNGTQEKIGAGPQMFQTLFPSRFNIESQEKSDDGTITISGVQTVLFNPPGVESAVRPAMYATMHQTTKLHKASGGWKVTGFENKFEKMDSLRSR